MKLTRIGAFSLALAAAVPGYADQAEETYEEEIVVVAHPLSGEGLAQASDVLLGEELDRKREPSIGATLGREPGVHSAQFGNAVGRPVIHGLGGPRVRVMEDRIDALDVSVTSADHAVTIEPFIAERIEVLKGSSALLYGSGAIGGVVDVHTARIPHQLPDRPVTGGIEARRNENTGGNNISAKVNGGAGGFAWHLDGTWKDGDDYEIPGFAESARLRALGAEEEAGAEQEVRGVLPGSAFDSESYAAGASIVADWGFVGVSVSELEADYGLPGGHAHEHEEGEEQEEGTPTLEMAQTRTDFELGVRDPFGSFTSLNVRLGINDYEHREIEPDGATATDFENDAWELRTELVYETGPWSGAFGFQVMDREFSAVGEEAFVPPVDTHSSGVFWVAERAYDRFDLEAGVRVGRVEHDPSAGSGERFTTYAASLGIVVPLDDDWTLGVIGDYSSRAPIGEELYSNGPHLVTNAFEIGDPTLDNERAAGLSATVRRRGAGWSAMMTVYFTQFADFIYEQATGAEIEELPVFRFRQDDADFVGVDVEVGFTFAEWAGGAAEFRGQLDLVNAQLDVSGNDNIPRIPPLRYGVGLEARTGPLLASIDYLRVAEQDDVAERELITDAYDDLSAYLGAEFPLGAGTLTLFLSGKNLTDDEQRHHTSFIKELAPAPGRTVEAGLRLLF